MSTRLLFPWVLQWERVERHHRRLDLCCTGPPTKDGWDDVVNFFIHAFSLIDWLVSEGVMTREQRHDAITQSSALQACRDLANAAKHRELTSSSIPAEVSLRRSYRPDSDRTEEWIALIDRRPVPVVVLAADVTAALRALLPTSTE